MIIKPSSLGDIVHTLPAVALIREANTKAKITWVINPEWATLLRGNPDIDHVHIFPRAEFRGLDAPRNLFPWIMKTRALRPDAAVDFQGLLRSGLIAKISRAKMVFGMSDGREGSRWFYDQVARVNRRDHAVDRYLMLAESFGAVPGFSLRFPLPTGDPLPHFDPYRPFVVLHPFARGQRKSLSTPVIEELCRALAPNRVVIVGKSARKVACANTCINLANQTSLLQLIWLIRAAAFTISVDSGPMHIAAAVTSKLLSIHTWTDPRRVGPYNRAAWVWKAGEILRVSDLESEGPTRKGRRFRLTDVSNVLATLQTAGVLQ